jgi:hypothetical protein
MGRIRKEFPGDKYEEGSFSFAQTEMRGYLEKLGLEGVELTFRKRRQASNVANQTAEQAAQGANGLWLETNSDGDFRRS